MLKQGIRVCWLLREGPNLVPQDIITGGGLLPIPPMDIMGIRDKRLNAQAFGQGNCNFQTVPAIFVPFANLSTRHVALPHTPRELPRDGHSLSSPVVTPSDL